MKTRKSSYLLAVILLFAFIFIVTSKQEEGVKTPQKESDLKEFINQYEEMKTIDTLNKVYRDSLDTLFARQTREKASESKYFRIESIKDSLFSEKQLHLLMEKINQRFDSLPPCKLKHNMMSWCATAHHIEVTFIRNTPEARSEFRKRVIDSPALRFLGSESPVRNNKTGISYTNGLCLYPEYAAYPDTAYSVSFILLNGSHTAVTCGEGYSLTYEGKDGQWYELPTPTCFIAIAYSISPGGHRRIQASLYPDINENQPGRYRLFYNVSLINKDGSHQPILMMAEFRLTDDYTDSRLSEKTEIPKEAASGNYIELPPSDEDLVYDVVEEMPEFPGGMPALMAFIKKNLQHNKATAKTRVIIQFTIDKEGNVIHPILIRSGSPEQDKEALRIVSLMPKWKPGRQNGKNKNVRFTIPVTFEPPAVPSSIK